MEKIFLNKRILVIAFFTVFTTGSKSAQSHATDHSVPVELNFVRWVKDHPIFQLTVNGNANNDEFTITVKDEFNNALYKDNIKAENFTKSFLLNTDEIGDHTLRFEIVSKKSGASKEFHIDRNSFVKEETA